MCQSAYLGAYQESVLSSVCLSWGLISVFSCLHILWSLCRTQTGPKLNDASSIIIFLAFSDFCLGLNTFVEGLTSDNNYYNARDEDGVACRVGGLCVLKACVAEFFGLSSFLWSAALCHSSCKQVSEIFLSFTRSHLLNQQSQRTGDALDSSSWTMLQYHLLCWGAPLLSTCLMLATKSAGPSGSHFCWVATDLKGNGSFLPLSLAIILFLFPLAIVEIYHLIVFRFLAKTLGQIPAGGPLLRKFIRILAILVGSKMALFLARTFRLFLPSNNVFAIGVFSVIGAPLQGLGDYLIFRYNRNDGGELAYSFVSSLRDGDSSVVRSNNSYKVSRLPTDKFDGTEGGGSIEMEISSIYSPISRAGDIHRQSHASSVSLLGGVAGTQ